MGRFKVLFDAIKENNVNFVETALKREKDGSWKLDEPFAGYTTLHLACLRGDYDSVKSLLSKYNVDPNKEAEDGARPITVAVLLEKYEIVELLLNAGANVNGELSNCLQIKYKDSFKSLIDDEWYKDFGSRMTLLTYAILKNNIELVDLLIRYNANVRIKSQSNRTLLMCAVDKLQDKIVELLSHVMTKNDINIRDNHGWTALHYFVKDQFKFKQIIKELIPACRTPDIMLFLIRAGADIKLWIFEDPRTLFENINHFPILYRKFILVLGKFEVLFDAIKENNVNLVKISLEQANDEYWQLDEPFAGYTILHLACFRGDYDCVKSLLYEYNVDPNKEAEDGARPITVAVLLERYEIVELLLNAGVSVNGELSNCLQMKYRYSFKSLMDYEWRKEHRPRIDYARCKDLGSRVTLLTYAIHKNDIALADLLIRHNANFRIKSHLNKTLLMCAAEKHYNKIVELLISVMNRNDINIRDKDGFTALHYLVKDEIECSEIIIESRHRHVVDSMLPLIRAGADINVTIDGDPETLFGNMVAFRKMYCLLPYLLPYYTYSENFKPLFYATKPLNNLRRYISSDPSFDIQETKVCIVEDLRLRQILGLPVLKEEVLIMENFIEKRPDYNVRSTDVRVNRVIASWKKICITFGRKRMSIYDILTMSKLEFLQLARDQSFCTAIDIASREKEKHTARIEARLEQAKKRIELLDKFSKFSFYITEAFHSLPFYCILDIIDYLPYNDLKNFANVLFLKEELENNEAVLIKWF